MMQLTLLVVERDHYTRPNRVDSSGLGDPDRDVLSSHVDCTADGGAPMAVWLR
jgi:hypothetical protein